MKHIPEANPFTESLAAQNAFAKKLAENPPTNKEEAEAASLVAGAFASLATAGKTREEIRDAATLSTRLQRWVQFAVGVVGITGTIGGAFGTFYFLNEFKKKESELAKEKAEIEKDKSTLNGIATERENARKTIDVSERLEKVLKKEYDITRTELATKEGALADSQKQLDTKELTLRGLEEDVNTREEAVKDEKNRVNKLREDTEALKKEVMNLPADTRTVLRQKANKGSLLAVILDSLIEQVPPSVPTDAAVMAFTPMVQQLFDPDGKVRGNAYNVLTGGKDRTNPAVLEALLKVGHEQLTQFRKLDVNSTDVTVKAEVSRIRRGLENVVVTLRDISRTVTKLPPANRTRVLAFADELIVLSFGVGEEAQSLKNWLKNGNY